VDTATVALMPGLRHHVVVALPRTSPRHKVCGPAAVLLATGIDVIDHWLIDSINQLID
jgi:hypothetical protein